MASKIVVDPAKLEAAVTKIETEAADYRKNYTQLYTEIESLTSWQGTDNLAFVNQIKGFEEDFNNMAKVLDDYATFLRNSATTYKTTQANVESSAKTLTN